MGFGLKRHHFSAFHTTPFCLAKSRFFRPHKVFLYWSPVEKHFVESEKSKKWLFAKQNDVVWNSRNDVLLVQTPLTNGSPALRKSFDLIWTPCTFSKFYKKAKTCFSWLFEEIFEYIRIILNILWIYSNNIEYFVNIEYYSQNIHKYSILNMTEYSNIEYSQNMNIYESFEYSIFEIIHKNFQKVGFQLFRSWVTC